MKIAILLSALSLFLLTPARAETSGTWMGTVVYINNTHIGVKAQAQTRDFLLGSDTGYFSGGQKVGHGEVTPGMLVVVSYTQSALFGSTRATRVDVKTFAVPAPAPAPTGTPY